MSIRRTALGNTVDMSALASQNELVRAVGNMNANARGDTIDKDGNVVVPVTKKVNDRYQRTVTNRAANVVDRNRENLSPLDVDTMSDNFELTAEELELEGTDEGNLEIEQMKLSEMATAKPKKIK